MKKLLFISESPLEKFNNYYYAKDTWIKFPLELSKYYNLTILTPVKSVPSKPGTIDQWQVDIGNSRIAAVKTYARFIDLLKVLFTSYFLFLRTIREEVEDADLIAIRLPSAISLFFLRSIIASKKPIFLFVGGNVETQVDGMVNSKGIKRYIYKILIKFITRNELKLGANSKIIFVYSQEIFDRFKGINSNLIEMRTPVVAKKDFYYREDTCLNKEIKIIRVCWLVESKGLEFLIEGVKTLVDQGYNISLSIIGHAKKDSYKQNLVKKINELGLSSRVKLIGWVSSSEMGQYYIDSDIHVISSLSEGTPRVIVEGAARGLPLVATRVGGISKSLKDSLDALLISSSSSQEIAEAIESIIDDEKLRKSLIKNGYEYAKKYSLDVYVPNIVNDIRKFH